MEDFFLPRFASVYSAVNECLHCWVPEGTCDGQVLLHGFLAASYYDVSKHHNYVSAGNTE